MRRGLVVLALGLFVAQVASCGSVDAGGDVLRVAVAANFAEPMRELASRWQASTGMAVRLSVGSTGALASQIEQGAPFDLFFAADAHRPAVLEEHGHTVPGTRRTYALGGLALWRPRGGLVDGLAVLERDDWQRLAIANPDTAPYGLAARQVLRATGLWERVRERLVLGQSIGQAHQFVASGAADLGFVARAQVERPGLLPIGSYHLVEGGLHEPIEQQVVRLVDEPGPRDFSAWFASDEVKALIAAYGYRVPERD